MQTNIPITFFFISIAPLFYYTNIIHISHILIFRVKTLIILEIELKICKFSV
jgi:hypothetical protein